MAARRTLVPASGPVVPLEPLALPGIYGDLHVDGRWFKVSGRRC